MALRAKKYFRDYELVETQLPNGKVYRRYVYRGDWYVRNVSVSRRTAERYVYVACSMVAAFLLVVAMRQNIAPNRGGFFAAVSILALIPAFCVLEGAWEAFFKKGNITKNDYQERLVMLRIMGIVAAALNLLLLGGYVANAIGPVVVPERGMSIQAAVFTGGAVLLYGVIAGNELCTKYTVEKAELRPREETDREELKKYYD